MATKYEKNELVVWDWLIIGVYFAICLGLGIYVSIVIRSTNFLVKYFVRIWLSKMERLAKIINGFYGLIIRIFSTRVEISTWCTELKFLSAQ